MGPPTVVPRSRNLSSTRSGPNAENHAGGALGRGIDGIAVTLFEELPYALVVTKSGGHVVAHNAAAYDQFGAQLRIGGVRCCDLVGCHVPNTPLADGCITELALRDRRLLPEIRLDLPGATGAVWAMAAPLGEDGHVVIHLRPGMRGDRRRRTEPHWINGPQLRIHCFGPLRIESEAGDLAGEWTQQRAGQVLGYLLCKRHRPVPPDELAEALWPDGAPTVLSTVRYFVHALRDRLEPGRPRRTPSAFVVFRRGGYGINRELVQIDADDFEREAEGGLRAAARHQRHAEQRLSAALQINTGDFLADFPYAEWVRSERDRLHLLASDALRALIEIRQACGDGSLALGLRKRLAELEPLDERVHRELIAHLLRHNQNSEAVRYYDAFRQRLRGELGRAPAFTMDELSEAPDASTGRP